jgi:hypothetical protein
MDAAEVTKMRAFIAKLFDTYETNDFDIVLSKILNDFRIEPDLSYVRNYYKVSQSFMSYMDFTDNINSTMVGLLNPIGKVIQFTSTRLFSHFDSSTRINMVTSRNRQRLLTSFIRMKEQADLLPSIQDAQNAILESGDQSRRLEESINAFKEQLSPRERKLYDEIEAQITANGDVEKIVGESNGRIELFNKVKDEISAQIAQIEARRSTFTTKDYTYKDGQNNTLTVTKETVEGHYVRFKELQAIMDGPDKTQKDAVKNEYKLLSRALLDYQIYIVGDQMLISMVSKYQAATQMLDTISIELDDHMVRLLKNLYVFKEYTNALLPVSRVEYLDKVLLREQANLKENQETLQEVEKDIKAIRGVVTFKLKEKARDAKTWTISETPDPQSGKSAPYGSGYAPFKKMKND